MKDQWNLKRKFLWASSRILAIAPSSVVFINILEENISLSDLQIGQDGETGLMRESGP